MQLSLCLTLLALFAPPQPDANSLLVPGQSWELLGENYQLTADIAVDKDGSVYFTDARTNRIMKIDPAGRISTWKQVSNGSHGIALGPDGRFYAGQHVRKRIVAFSSDGSTESVITEGIQTHHLTVTSRNLIYFTVPPEQSIWVMDSTGNQRRVVYGGFSWPRGLRETPDRQSLVVADPRTPWLWKFHMQEDGSLVNGHPFCGLAMGDAPEDPDPGGMAFDSEGFLYVATSLGVQVCDPQGRLTSTIASPAGTDGLSNVFFAGTDLQWLYVTSWNKVYRRPARRRGSTQLWRSSQR